MPRSAALALLPTAAAIRDREKVLGRIRDGL